ncbi:lasso peptide biosynthesis PqqD family chaperone [Francisella philomiragia]|uniref:lasso peptide biosynthesis PqqD family chaperone n=1 Tax=Francisella philomiragia TaxID=28110 RepID=UPI0019063856|nr:lasso peptide biosynthesis PqqD family chaperone [Francisella philomiragia]MBK2025256.1 lasso peptide biosynthesis PqqD family chaperone [Francisella philomiragia]
MSNLNIENQLYKNEDIYSSEVDGETIMMNIDNNAYYTTQEIGNRIWELLDSLDTPKAICDQLMQEYEVSQEQCQNEVLQFLEQLLEHGIVTKK